jgi:hypothetical protein
MSQITGYGTTKGIYRQSAITLTDNQEANLALDANGNLLVNVASGSGSGGVSAVDEAAFTAGASSFAPLGGVYNDSAAALTSGQQGTGRFTANRALHMNLRNGSGTELGVATADGYAAASVFGTGNYVFNGTTWDRSRGAIGDGAGAAGMQNIVGMLYNGSTYDRVRSGPTTGSTLISPPTATGSAVPANAFYIAGINSSGNLAGIVTYDRANDGATGTGILSIGNYIYNGTNNDRIRSAINGTNSTGTGIVASGLVAQLDDISPTAITENQFGNLRMDSARQLRVNGQQAPDATALNTYSVHLTSNTTTTPTAATAYISSIVISVGNTGTTSTVTIQDKQGTPLKLVASLSTASALSNGNDIYTFNTPVKMVSGIDIVTAGAAAATIDIWINYYQ